MLALRVFMSLRVFMKAGAGVPTVMTESVTAVYQEAQCQFPLTIIISHLLANSGHIYQVCCSPLYHKHSSRPCSHFYSFSSSTPPHFCIFQAFLSSFFFLPERGDMAINLRVANELHLTIKCTGNGTFHLQEDQWQ